MNQIQKVIEEKTIRTKCQHCGGEGFIQVVNSKWLRQQREKTNLSLRYTAKKLRISAAYLSDIERGKRQGNKDIINFYENL
jgi:predicted transcriptional regulator